MDELKELFFSKTEGKITPNLSIHARYGNSVLVRNAGEQLFYLILELSSSSSTQTQHIPLNLALVLDRSTSMHGPKFEMVKTNTIWLLRHLHEEDTLSIVAFSDQAEVLVSQVHFNERPFAESRISMLQPGGSTEIYNGLVMGLAELEKNFKPNQANHLILLTDGRTYGDEITSLELAKVAANEGIVIHCFGYGNKWNDIFLDQLVSISGGNCIFVSSPKELHRFLEDKINHIDKIMINSISMNCWPGNGVELKYTFRLSPEPGMISMENPLRLGSITPDQNLKILFEFSIGGEMLGEEKSVKVLESELSIGIPFLDNNAGSIKINFEIPTSEKVLNEPPDSEIMHAMSDITLYRMQENARRELSAGEHIKASRHLQYLATHLIAKGQKELARTALQEADRIIKDKKMSDMGVKQIKYGTRSLINKSGMGSDDL